MAPAGHLDPAHNPGPPGLHTPNLGPTPGSQLHHPNPPPPSRQPLGQPNTGPIGELAFNPATGMMGPPSMTGAGEASEPALDVSNPSCAGGGSHWGLSVHRSLGLPTLLRRWKDSEPSGEIVR